MPFYIEALPEGLDREVADVRPEKARSQRNRARYSKG